MRARQEWHPWGIGRIVRKLGDIAPDIEIVTEWRPDPHYEWDGDGPDPRAEGYEPYDVIVIARVWDGRRKVEGSDVLGGVYVKPDARDPEVHGYFYQMLAQALVELATEDLPDRLARQVDRAKDYVESEMRRIYEMERRRRGRGS